jgi:hypothetical protein
MGTHFHEHFYRKKLEVTLVDLAKIVQDPCEVIEIYAL